MMVPVARLLCTVLSLAVAVPGLACSARTLIAVGGCLDGSTSVKGDACAAPADGMAQDGSATANLRKGLVGLWHLDESPGATTAADSSGQGNDGTLMGLDPTNAWVKGGKLGNALAVNGLGYVAVPSSASIANITSAVTISAWVYLDGPIDTSNYGTAVSRQIGTSVDQYYHLSLWQSDAKAHLYIMLSSGAVPQQPGSVIATIPKTWTHLAGTYDGAMAILYVDGAQVGAVRRTGTFPADSNPVILGGNANGTSQTVSELFPGRIDEVALYNRALDAAEIQELANAASF